MSGFFLKLKKVREEEKDLKNQFETYILRYHNMSDTKRKMTSIFAGKSALQQQQPSMSLIQPSQSLFPPSSSQTLPLPPRTSCPQFQSFQPLPPMTSCPQFQSPQSFQPQIPFKSYQPQVPFKPFVPQPVGKPFQPIGTPFVPQPIGTPFVPQPIGTPFVPQPSGTPFVPQPIGTPFVPQPSGTPFVPQPMQLTVPQPMQVVTVPETTPFKCNNDVLQNKMVGIIVCGSIGHMMGSNDFTNIHKDIRFSKRVAETKTVRDYEPNASLVPLAAVNMSDADTLTMVKTILTDIDDQHTTTLFIKLIRHLIEGSLPTADSIINEAKAYASVMKNKRLFLQLELVKEYVTAKHMPDGAFGNFLIDYTDLFCLALFIFLINECEPLEVMRTIPHFHKYNSGDVIGKTLGTLIGASYGAMWLPNDFQELRGLKDFTACGCYLAEIKN